MGSIQPFEQIHAARVLNWIRSPEELFHWSTRTDYPWTNHRVFLDWHADPEISACLLSVEGEIVGYGEIWLDESDGSAELARLLVAPEVRGQGIGRVLIAHLLHHLSGTGFTTVWVRILPTNAAALSCYRKAGFVRVSAPEEARLNEGERHQFHWMRKGDVVSR